MIQNASINEPSAAQQPFHIPPALKWSAAGFSVAACAAILMAMMVWIRVGPRVTDGMAKQIGEVLFDKALRLEKSGEKQNAILAYKSAVNERFTNADQRIEAQIRLGNLLLWEEGANAALPHLEAAAGAGEHSIWLYLPLCESYLQAGRPQDCLRYASEWRDKALQSKDTVQQADAALYLGRAQLALKRNDEALRAFLTGHQIAPGSLISYYAGQLLSEAGRYKEAAECLDPYVKNASGESAAWAKVLLERANAALAGK